MQTAKHYFVTFIYIIEHRRSISGHCLHLILDKIKINKDSQSSSTVPLALFGIHNMKKYSCFLYIRKSLIIHLETSVI